MEVSMLDAAVSALFIILEPERMMFMVLGVIFGLAIGILPGIGGTTGLALLLPFTFTMESYSAFAFLLGLGTVTSTSDTIPAVLFGIPGSNSAQATVMDGYPMGRRGEAGRALAAAYTASLMGGLMGALLLAFSIPMLRPVIAYVQSPELLALSMFGIAMVAMLSGGAPLRGLTVGCVGVLLALVGSDPSTGTQRWTFGTVYLYDGLALVPIVLGLFALPELCDLAIRRTTVQRQAITNISKGMWQGCTDAFKNWFLVLRCSWLGAGLGALPGIPTGVVDWISYGHALSTEKGATQTFGKGDVRGVIAPEACVNATDGGQLVPTLAFGVPASASMALLLVAFMMHGLVPGPDMVTVNLEMTYSFVWTLAIANIFGTVICFSMSGQLAKIVLLRYTIIIPIMLSVVYVGAFQSNRDWGDLYLLLFFGLVGWTMKQLKWPRPPLILGLVLGGMIERYMFISVTRHGFDWLTRPMVMIVFAIALVIFFQPLVRNFITVGGFKGMAREYGGPRLRFSSLLGIFLVGVTALAMTEIGTWPARARLVPQLVGWGCIIFGTMSILAETFRRAPVAKGQSEVAQDLVPGMMHMDLASDHGTATPRQVLGRFAAFFGWLLGFMISMATIGLIPTVPIFIIAYMRVENRERWALCVPLAVVMTIFVYVVFDRLLSIPWPPTLISEMFPAIRQLRIPSV